MSLTTYTSYSEVRAVLGVSKTELPDSALAVPAYSTLVTLALEDVNTNIPDEFATVSALPSISRTKQQTRFLDLVSLYAPFALAKELLVSLPMFSVRQLTDGKAEFQRQVLAMQELRDSIDTSVQAIKQRLADAYLILYPSESVATRVTAVRTTRVGLLVDPVTNA